MSSRTTRIEVGWKNRDIEVIAKLGHHETEEIRDGRRRRGTMLLIRHIPCGGERTIWASALHSWRRDTLKTDKPTRTRAWCLCVPVADRRGYRRAKNSQKAEHRVVMERLLGRELFEGESVHHINGVRADNRAENLELWVTRQPTGQRAVDLVKYAKEILRRYEPESLAQPVTLSLVRRQA